MRSYKEILSDLESMLENKIRFLDIDLLYEVVELLKFQQSRIRWSEIGDKYSMEDIIIELQENAGGDLNLDLAQRAIDCMIDLRRWKDTLVDVAICDWCLSDDNYNDPRKMINSIIAWNTMIALDPCVSEDAVKLRDTFREFAEYIINNENIDTGIYDKAEKMLEEHK